MSVLGSKYHNPSYQYEIRPEMKQAIDLYAEQGIPMGSFLTALMANDLMRALGGADDGNRRDIFQLASYVYNETPSGCHGSYEIVNKWIEKKIEERENANS